MVATALALLLQAVSLKEAGFLKTVAVALVGAVFQRGMRLAVRIDQQGVLWGYQARQQSETALPVACEGWLQAARHPAE